MKIGIYDVSLVRDRSIEADTRKAEEPAAVAAIVRATIGPKQDREHFIVVLLDARNKVIGVNVVSVGTLTASLVHPREVFKPAILASAAAVILAHNHPSGDCSPSPEDRECTRRLARAGELLGIRILDHVIVSDEGHYSFRSEGLL